MSATSDPNTDPPANPSKPTIQAAISQYSDNFRQAHQSLDPKAAMLSFLQTPDLPPYYQLKAHLNLSGADTNDVSDEALRAHKLHLKRAEKAIAVANKIYIHDPDDSKSLHRLQNNIDESWWAYDMCRGGYYTDSEDDEQETGS